MNLISLKISAQLRLGFGIILVIIAVSGILSWIQNNELADQTRRMYDHPLTVRRALAIIESSVLDISRHMRSYIMESSEENKNNVSKIIAVDKAEIDMQLGVLYDRYLGPRKDIDDLRQEYLTLVNLVDESFQLVMNGNVEVARMREREGSGIKSKQVIKVLDKINHIHEFARNKADQFNNDAITIKQRLNMTNLVFIISSLILAFVIITYITRSITRPLSVLTQATYQFKEGERNIRSAYTADNEFGELSKGFNEMADTVVEMLEMNDKSAAIAGIMLAEDDPKAFANNLLSALIRETSAHYATLYYINASKTYFLPFESVGIGMNNCKSFEVGSTEGEIGLAVNSKEITLINDIPEDSEYRFYSSAVSIRPRSILSIPIISSNEVIAIINLASLQLFSETSLELLHTIYPMLNARLIGLFTYQKLVDSSEELEVKNKELEEQRKRLADQSAELIEQNKELEVQKRHLHEASRLKTVFLSNMSHELRTPLNSVIALSGILNRKLKDVIDEENYGYIDIIERNGKHLLDLINDILDIARIEAGKEELNVTNFTIFSLFEEVFAIVKPNADKKNVGIDMKLIDRDLAIMSDFKKCLHIMQNIVSNAVKFTEKGTINIGIEHTNNEVIVEVSDPGIGISDDDLPYIFDEFRQVDSSNSKKHEGTGLGLAIANKYVKLLGGRIEVESELGKGSVFTIHLPKLLEAEDSVIEVAGVFPQLENNYKVESEVGAASKTIMVVEDSDSAIIQMKDFLEGAGFNALFARNGVEALSLLEEQIPDAMILDLMMPEMDGFELLKTIREKEDTSRLPVLILTAKYVSKEELSFLKHNQIKQLLQKGSINKEQLLTSIRRLLYAKPSVESKSKRKPGRPTKKKVLIVEDNYDNMLTLKALLGSEYKIYEAVDGKDGIETAIREVPDLIFMDIALPGISGIDALISIREHEALEHVPVIAVTASALKQNREEILSFGFDAFIPKPIEFKELTKYLTKYLK